MIDGEVKSSRDGLPSGSDTFTQNFTQSGIYDFSALYGNIYHDFSYKVEYRAPGETGYQVLGADNLIFNEPIFADGVFG